LPDASIHHEVLDDGPELLLQPVRTAPVVAVQVWARVGSADERPGEEGLAHFHEHMLFKGTEQRGVGEVPAAVENAGGRINAYTSLDETVYHLTLPAAQLELGVDVLADAALHSVFDPEEIEREKDVVLEEIRRGEDSPWHVLSELVFAEAYRVHSYRRPILGTPESVASFDREKVTAFFRRWYGAENLLVVAVGDFDPQRARDAVARAFAGSRRGPRRPGDRPAEPEPTGLRTALLRRPFQRASLELAWLGVPFSHPDTPHLDLLALILGQGDSSRLVRRVRDRDQLAEGVDAFCLTPRDRGLFSVSLETDPERAAAAVAGAVAEVERARRAPVRGEELEKARANFLALEHFERESVGGLGRKLGTFHVEAGDWRHESAYFEAIRKATPADLLRAAREHLDPGRLTVGAVLPEDARLPDAAALEDAVARGVERTARALAGAGAPARRADVESYRLPCGAALHVARRPGLPVVAGRAAGRGGLLAETASTAGITSFLTSVWTRGTRSHSAADFARAVESLAGEVDGFSGRNSQGASFECTSDKLEPVLDLFAEVLLEPALDPAEIERQRRETLAAIARREDRLGQRAFLLFAETLFRTHPYRLPILGTAESVRGLTREALVEHHARLVHPANLVFGVCGDVDPDRLADQLGERFADLESGGAAPPVPADEPPLREIREVELRRPREQAHLVLGFRGLALDDPDRYALEALVQILAGQGGRLFLELRDRRGLAYTVTAMSVEGLSPGYLALYMGTAPEKLEAARAGMLEQLEALVQEPPSAAELDGVKRHLVGNFAIDQQRSAVRAAHLCLDALYGLGPDDDRHYAERVEALAPQDLLRVARRVVDLEAYVLATIRP